MYYDEKLIGLVGVVGSGKNHRAAQEYPLYLQTAFADGVKEIAHMIYGYKNDDSEKFKKSIFKNEMLDIVLTGRDIYVNAGDGIKQKFGANFWIDYWEKRAYNPDKKIIVTDVRYPNEANAIFMKGGILLFCDYHSDRYDPNLNYESEKMAQFFIKNGLKDGDKIEASYMREYNRILMREAKERGAG